MKKHQETTKQLSLWILSITALISLFFAATAEASITMAWQPSTTNADGTPCTDLAGYKIYYDTDQSGAPYDGASLAQGASPITVPVSSLADPSNPAFALSGMASGSMYYIAVTAYDTIGNESGYSNEIAALDTTVDADHDGIPDDQESIYGLNPNSNDSDGDSISDFDEWGKSSLPADTDGDGMIDALDTDSDNDGVLDSDETGVDRDMDGVPDRLDNKTATMATAQGKMSVVLNHPTARLIQTTFIPALSSNSNPPQVDFPYGGVSYKITGITAGESVLLTIIMPQNLPDNAEYWKYDDTGFHKLASQISGNEISFEITDGEIGDSDHTINGMIEDPGYIGIPQSESVANTAPTTTASSDTGGGGGGGGGCSLSREPAAALPDALLLLLPLLFVTVLKIKKLPSLPR